MGVHARTVLLAPRARSRYLVYRLIHSASNDHARQRVLSLESFRRNMDTGSSLMEKDLFAGGGEMAKAIKTKDWSKTPLGPIESWPQSLRTVVSLVQASNSPISLIWGSGHVQIYNDGYWPICGDKHPAS